MKFVVLFSTPARLPPGTDTNSILRTNRLPDPVAMESVATKVIPAIQKFGPFQSVYAAPNANCLGIASVLHGLARIPILYGIDELEEVPGETVTEIQRKIVRLVRRVAREATGSMIFVTHPSGLAGIHCDSQSQYTGPEIEASLRAMDPKLDLGSFQIVDNKIRAID